MSKKDYERIARIVSESLPHGEHGARLRLFARSFAAEEERLNPRFDPDRFFAACGVAP